MKGWGREWGLAVALLAVAGPAAAVGQAPSEADPTFQLDFSDPGLSPSRWTLTLRPDGSGHFRSQASKTPDDASPGMVPPAVDRDIQVSAAYAGHVFAAAERHKWFSEQCESHLKVAFQGWKTLTYTGPQAHGSCTFNYSKDKEIQELGDSLEAVVETILEGCADGNAAATRQVGSGRGDGISCASCGRRPGATGWRHPGDSGAADAGRHSVGESKKAGADAADAGSGINWPRDGHKS